MYVKQLKTNVKYLKTCIQSIVSELWIMSSCCSIVLIFSYKHRMKIKKKRLQHYCFKRSLFTCVDSRYHSHQQYKSFYESIVSETEHVLWQISARSNISNVLHIDYFFETSQRSVRVHQQIILLHCYRMNASIPFSYVGHQLNTH